MKNKIKGLSMNIFLVILLMINLIILNGYSRDENQISEKPQDFKCLKCHKGSKSLENIVKEKDIVSAEDLRYLIRSGPKSGLHKTVPDEDLEKAIQYLNLK